MSALSGIWNFDGRPTAADANTRILAAQAIYGPHHSAAWDDGYIALGRRLHRTLPEDIHDRGPVAGGGGRFILVADVRLDNRDELIADLQIAPERARITADAGILMAAWERWQENVFAYLYGDYAFALWDVKDRRLFLARDHLGNRPLHYHSGEHFFAFASMPKGLHALSQIPRAPDEERAAEFLALLPETGSQTFFRGVERIEPGFFATITSAGIFINRHWPPQRKTIKLAGPDEYAEALRSYLDQAVRTRLRGAGTAVAAHLSAGFDSSIVATSAAIQMASSNGKVVGFTAVPREGYDGPVPRGRTGDEGPLAAATASLYANMEHVFVRTNDRTPFDNLDRAFLLYDRPVLNICNLVWADAINDAARARKLGVMLTGQMGNMTISYNGETLLPQLLRHGRWVKWFREGTGVVRNGHMRWLGMLAASFGPYTPLPIWGWINQLLEGNDRGIQSYSAINPTRFAELNISRRARERALDLSYRPRKDGIETRLWVLRRIDLGNYIKGCLGGWGIDQRDPTTDRRLIEFSLSVPEEQLLANGETKALTRRAFAGRLPPGVVNNRCKGLQAIDWHEGLTAARQPLTEEIERLGNFGPAMTAIDLARLKQLVENWPKEGWEKPKVSMPYRLALLRAMSTGHFLRKAGGSNA